MIRTLAASAWLPLLYWTAAVIAVSLGAHDELFNRLAHHEFQTLASASAPTPPASYDHSVAFQSHAINQEVAAVSKPAHLWQLRISILRRFDRSISNPVTAAPRNVVSIPAEAKTTISTPGTMLSIRVDSPEQLMVKSLVVRCRTSMAISSAHGKTVTIHGVVTEEVVSSAGKILIMAGSRVVGSGTLDPENGRFKSDGLWSIFLDGTELNVQAQLLDRPAGLPGILGQAASNKDLRNEADEQDDRSFGVPRNAPFVLELHGGILLRDL